MNSACEHESSCESCGDIHMGGLIDPRLQFCCFACVQDGSADIAEGDEVYRAVLTCACGNSGAVNYDDGERIGYYCGGSERCIP